MTVTKALRDSFFKVTGEKVLHLYSDSRLHKKAVGVKIVNYSRKKFPLEVITSIVNDMESKGFQLVRVKENIGGTRFCFYKLKYSNVE